MKKALPIFAVLFCISLVAAAPVYAQASPQPTLYTYVALWGVPRAHWADMAKFQEGERSTFDKLVDDGILTGYGACVYEVHEASGFTHCDWFQANSVGNILRALAALQASATSAPVLAEAKHVDAFYRSTMYGSRPGTFHNGYLWLGHFTLKPEGGVSGWTGLFGKYIRPALDKMLQDREVVAYQLFTPLIHTPGSSNTLNYSFVTSSPDGIDKFFAAVSAIEEQDPAIPAAIDPLELSAGHYDIIASVPVIREKGHTTPMGTHR
jgi:hypothetical protein